MPPITKGRPRYMISPGLNSSVPPRFYELGVFKFQALCAELLDQDTKYSDSQVYGRNGQAQKGIDILAIFADGSGIDVGQCKCWEGDVTASKVQEASDEFLKHLDHWKERRLKRFIPFAACPTDDTKVQDQVLIEIERFEQLGIAYEAWDARKLQRQLRPHREVVWAHTQSEFWVNEICGPQGKQADSATIAGLGSVIRRQGLLMTELAEERNRDLDRVRELAAEGKGVEALERVVALQLTAAWQDMPDIIRAKAVRIRASLTLNVLDDVSTAQQLLETAKALCPSANTRALEALILKHSTTLEAALEFLSVPGTVEEWD